jgi:hypothetical protein
MNRLDEILKYLSDNRPFALSRFNDGEMMGVEGSGVTVARGRQYVGETLHRALGKLLGSDIPMHFLGLPCAKCFPTWHDIAKRIAPHAHVRVTHATVLTNRNLVPWKAAAPRLFLHRSVAWIAGEDQNEMALPFSVATRIKVPSKNAWTSCAQIAKECLDVPYGSVCLLSCGPTATVLAGLLFIARPDSTWIDVGSVWDPETRGVSYPSHDGTLERCTECN